MYRRWHQLLGLLAAVIGIVLAVPGFVATAAAAAADAQQHPHFHSHGEARDAWMFHPADDLLSLLKTDESTLRRELGNGKSLAEIAQERGVDKQKVIDLLVAQQRAKLDEAVKSGKLTEDQAKRWKEGLEERTRRMVDGQGRWYGHHRGGRYLQDAAQVLGMTPKQLVEELKKGKSVVQIGKEKGISESQIVDKLLAKEKERIEKKINRVWDPEAKSKQAE